MLCVHQGCVPKDWCSNRRGPPAVLHMWQSSQSVLCEEELSSLGTRATGLGCACIVYQLALGLWLVCEWAEETGKPCSCLSPSPSSTGDVSPQTV
jgi:hypothetical protein